MKRHRLGQHYLADPEVVAKMVKSAEVGPGDRVLEIGTGRGALTRELAGLGSSFEAFEVDPENHARTLSEVEGLGASVHLGDAFLSEPGFDVLVSSLPYSESARFVEWLAKAKFRRAVVLLQSDFVEKVLAPPGTRDYRAVSALSQISTEVKVLEKVRREAFEPPPRVDSVIVSIFPRRRMSREEVARVKRLFTLRRKKVAAAARELGVEGGEGYGDRRVYSLSPEEVMEICR